MTQANQAKTDTGVLLLNMGGAAKTAEVQPFLEALFGDPAIIQLPLGFLYQKFFARMVSKRRAPKVAPHYEAIGGSPILAQTWDQAAALERRLGLPVGVAMRYSEPRAKPALQSLQERGVRRVIALPLYPQYSRTTTASSLDDLRAEANALGLALAEIRSYPDADWFIASLLHRFQETTQALKELDKARVLLVAHSIPVKYIRQGDPYVSEVEKTAEALRAKLPATESTALCFQSRVGPVEWQGPFIVDEIARAGKDGIKTVIVVPISFVSEHLETLYELDIELADLARNAGVGHFLRVGAVRDEPRFIEGLARLVETEMGER